MTTAVADSHDDVCQLCKKEAYLNPTMKLLKSLCGSVLRIFACACGGAFGSQCSRRSHLCCDACITIQFAKQLVLLCPVCKSQLRRANFIDEKSSNAALDREVAVRRKIEREWNKREEDFASLDEYNDYLEEREDIVYNLVNGIDVEATQERVAANRSANAELIARNAAKREAEEKLELEQIRIEEERWLLRRAQFLRQDQRERLVKLRAEAEFLAGLSAGDDVGSLERRLRERRENARAEAAELIAEEEAEVARERDAAAEAERARERKKLEDDAIVLKLKEEQRMRKRVVGAGIREAPMHYDASVLGDASRAAAPVRVKPEPVDDDEDADADVDEKASAAAAIATATTASATSVEEDGSASKAKVERKDVKPVAKMPRTDSTPSFDSPAVRSAGGWLKRHETDRYQQETFAGVVSVLERLRVAEDDNNEDSMNDDNNGDDIDQVEED